MVLKRIREIWRDRPCEHWIYFLIGGMYQSAEFPKRVKIFWFALNAFFICTLTAVTIVYFLTAKSVTLLNAAIVLSINGCGIVLMIFVPLVALYCKSDITTLLKYLAENTSAGEKPFADESKLLLLKRVEPVPKNLIMRISLGLLTYVSAPLLDFAFNYDEQKFGRVLEHHTYAVPYTHCISSLSTYSAVYFYEILILGVTFLNYSGSTLLVEVITRRLNNIALNFCGRFQQLNALFVGKVGPADVSPELLSHFEMKLTSLIKDYQIFINTIKLLRFYILINCGFLLPSIFCFIAFQLFAHFLADFSFVLNLKVLSTTFISQLHIYPYCSFGSAIEEMQDEIAYQVYNLPWYCLPPRRRKNIYIFLTQAQRFAPVKIFNVFPVNKIFFPKFFRLAYSLVNVLAAVLKRNPAGMK